MRIELGAEVVNDFSAAVGREWLECNGEGGYASSTIAGCHTRRYHGLLVLPVEPFPQRAVLVSKIDETITTPTGARWDLATNQYPGAVAPQGFSKLHSFEQELFPSWNFAPETGVVLQKTVVMVTGEPTTLVVYENRGAVSLNLALRPLIAARPFHGLRSHRHGGPNLVRWVDGTLAVGFPGLPVACISTSDGSFSAQSDWYYSFEYLADRYRGYDYTEDLFSPGLLSMPLPPGSQVIVALSTAPVVNGTELLTREARRRRALYRSRSWLPREAEPLLRAADQCIISRPDGARTIIAGYPWFADWGRDAFIGLPGLCLATERYDDAVAVLRHFAGAAEAGLIPNRFREEDGKPEFTTIDGSLWFVNAVYQTALVAPRIAREFLPVVEKIIAAYRGGTLFGIHEDGDGLVTGGDSSTHLTWMDVKIGEWSVTSRHGKAVDINALWYNAQRVLASLLDGAGRRAEARAMEEQALLTKRSFLSLFTNTHGGYLYDVVNERGRDDALRPNQLLALSLPFPVVEGALAASVLTRVERELLTPLGLRSLSQRHPDYVGQYRGDPRTRDTAYHQGTVWPWLLGPFLSALHRVEGAGRVRTLLAPLVSHLSEAGIGTISEIADGNPPHLPRGCISQAWSIGEVLRVLREIAE